MRIAVIGAGYVGLVTGTCFAEMGNHVTCVDIDSAKIEELNGGSVPIYEPGLEEMVLENTRESRLQFTTSFKEACAGADVHFIAVGTPSNEDGSADLQYILAAAKQLGQYMEGEYNTVVDKSTVPVGTAEKVRSTIQEELDKRGSNVEFDVVSNPEFLKEGAAIDDFMQPDRIVIGASEDRTIRVMRELYAPFSRKYDRILIMGVRDAEMTKYAANAMLATKISFINEIATVCEKMDVDVENVRIGIGSDDRIGYQFIYPGCGYGGSCFPKDIRALQKMAVDNKVEPIMLNAVEARNNQQKTRLFEKIVEYYDSNELHGKCFALWGLAFKPGTDDMREASSLVLIKRLIDAGATIHAHDPVAIEACRREIPVEWVQSGKIKFFEHQYDVLLGADAMALVTEWKSYRNPDFDLIKTKLAQPIIFDGRNQFSPASMHQLGIYYSGIGRKSL
jgi:UDPglucose 6-dehydrogenase